MLGTVVADGMLSTHPCASAGEPPGISRQIPDMPMTFTQPRMRGHRATDWEAMIGTNREGHQQLVEWSTIVGGGMNYDAISQNRGPRLCFPGLLKVGCGWWCGKSLQGGMHFRMGVHT